jgi:simple sugar transport system ATP-binding protein
MGTDLATDIAIELRDIVKRFPGVVANDGVNLTVRRGTIHAIVGENGAGKSTLVKTLYGAHQPDEGTITVDGQQRHFRTPKDAIAVGIGMVFQHFMLADNLTVWENVVLGHEPGNPLRISIGAARQRLVELGNQYGLSVDPDDLIADLGVGEKQRTEILKVLYRGANILILDEPTAVLVPQEVDELFRSLRELAEGGATVIFISHKLDEVLRYADGITVIRAGRTVGEVPDPSQVTAHELAEMMVGSELPSPETRESTVTDVVRLEVRNLRIRAEDFDAGAAPLTTLDVSTANASTAPSSRVEVRSPSARMLLDNVSFVIRSGEILGVAGVEGNGQTELIEALLGLRASDGQILLDGEDVSELSTLQRREHGIGYIPQDRQKDGLVLAMPLWENVMLGHQTMPPFAKGAWVDRAGAHARTDALIDEFDVRTPGPDVPAYTLSGGNQQKLVVGREMTADPRVLVAAHPTRGVDVGAQATIWDILRDARAKGLATLLISADLEELIGLSDRLLVMLRGSVVAELDPSTVTPVELGSYMTGVVGQHADSGGH